MHVVNHTCVMVHVAAIDVFRYRHPQSKQARHPSQSHYLLLSAVTDVVAMTRCAMDQAIRLFHLVNRHLPCRTNH